MWIHQANPSCLQIPNLKTYIILRVLLIANCTFISAQLDPWNVHALSTHKCLIFVGLSANSSKIVAHYLWLSGGCSVVHLCTFLHALPPLKTMETTLKHHWRLCFSQVVAAMWRMWRTMENNTIYNTLQHRYVYGSNHDVHTYARTIPATWTCWHLAILE